MEENSREYFWIFWRFERIVAVYFLQVTQCLGSTIWRLNSALWWCKSARVTDGLERCCGDPADTKLEIPGETRGVVTPGQRVRLFSNLATGNASTQLDEIQGVVCVRYRYWLSAVRAHFTI
jgi:hypothetical protein